MQREWDLRRNCSLTPRQLASAYLLLCAGGLGVALGFALHGIWIVLPFSLLELAGVGAAFVHYARHALDRDHIALSERCLLVERVRGGHIERLRFNPHWTRVLPPGPGRRLVGIESGGRRTDIGAFVNAAAREQVARELRRELRAGYLS
ncbi:MAG TPA: DUF2244 domain-containing protein [Telluria sp.]|nr:DUF2244 domain-containing protein [Telluria sp.]